MSLIVVVTNDGTGTEDVGHYRVSVRINEREIWLGGISGHLRKNGWASLLMRVALARMQEVDASQKPAERSP